MRSSRGFTLIELLVVIAIIGLLSSIVLASLSTARSKAKVAKARAEINSIITAMALLSNDTGKLPDAFATKSPDIGGCPLPLNGAQQEVDTNAAAAGLNSTDGNFPGWAGPYITIGLDPWGFPYVFDDDYDCAVGAGAIGCAGYGANVRAVHSRGPNGSAYNIYDADNIVKVICAR